MSCLRTSRAWYLLIVSLWLLLTTARQAFDSIGKLWIPIIFNSLQIFSCICGLIAVIHRRMRLLFTVMLLNSAFMIYNTALILRYNEYFGVTRDMPVLSAGLPNSYSFFLRYTPFCKSYYNLTNLQWMQVSSCLIPYYWIESAQALLHIFMATLSILLTFVLLRQRKFKKKNDKIRKKELCNEHCADTITKNCEQYHDGYPRRSFDASDRQSVQQSVRPENGYLRHSDKRFMRKSYRQVVSADQQPENFQEEFAMKKLQSLSSLVIEERREMQLFHSIRSIKSSNKDGILLDWPAATTARADSEGICRSASLKILKIPTTEGVRRILSREEINGARNETAANSTYTKGHSPNNLKSLISFDPKSNVLLRVQNHIDDDKTDDDDVDNGSNYQIDDCIQRQQQSRTYGLEIQPKLEYEEMERIAQPKSEYQLSSFSPSCRASSIPIFTCTKVTRSDHPSTSRSWYTADRWPRSVHEQFHRYPGGELDTVHDGTKRCSFEEAEESRNVPGIPIFSNNSLLV